MKKVMLVVCLLIASMGAKAQFEQGKWIVNPSLTGLSLTYSKSEKAKFGIGVDMGTFVADGIALMVKAGADWSRPIDIYSVGVGGRFYFNKTGVYLGAGLDLDRYRLKGGSSNTDWGFGIEAGYAYFLSRTITVEPSVYYKWRFNDGDLSKFGIKVGFGLYL